MNFKSSIIFETFKTFKIFSLNGNRNFKIKLEIENSKFY